MSKKYLPDEEILDSLGVKLLIYFLYETEEKEEFKKIYYERSQKFYHTYYKYIKNEVYDKSKHDIFSELHEDTLEDILLYKNITLDEYDYDENFSRDRSFYFSKINSLTVNELIKDSEHTNNNILIPFESLNEKHPVRFYMEKSLSKNDHKDPIICLIEDNCFIPSYQSFCDNLTGNVLNRLVAYFEDFYQSPKDFQRPFNDIFIHPNDLNTIFKNLELRFDFEFETTYDYMDKSDWGEFRRIIPSHYHNKDKKNHYNEHCATRYIITKAKMKTSSKELLKSYLTNKGFPYDPNYNEYIRFLKKMDFDLDNLHISFDFKGIFNYYISNFVSTFFPSKIKPKQFINHTHIVGRSGSGKSEFLKNIIKQLGSNCILIDPHGDIANSLDRKENFFKIAPTESCFVINPFDIDDKSIDNRELVAEEIIQLLQEIIQDSNVSVLMKTISFPIISTLLKLPYADFRMFADCINPISGIEYLEHLTPLVDDHHKRLWEDLKTDAYDSTKRSIFNRLQSFLNKHKIISTVCGYDDFSETIKRVEQGENLVISLPIPQLGEDVSEVLGRFFMCRMQIWAKRRQNIEQQQRKSIVLIVDECQNFLSQETAKTLDQFGRKFGLYMILAHQHIGQIDDRGLKGSILANCKNKIVGLADYTTNSTMAKAFGIDVDEFSELKKGNFWGLFEDQEPLKFYSRMVKFKTVSETVNYAHSQNMGFVDGWELAQIAHKPTTQNNQFKPKFDL